MWRCKPTPRRIAVVELRGDKIKPFERTPAFVELPNRKDITALGALPSDDPALLQPVVNRLTGLETGEVGKLCGSQQTLHLSHPGARGDPPVRLWPIDQARFGTPDDCCFLVDTLRRKCVRRDG